MKKTIRGPGIAVSVNETGEVLHMSDDDDAIQILTTTEQEKALKEKEKYYAKNFRKDEPYVKLYIGNLVKLKKYLTTAEYALAISLAHFVSWEDCVLRYTDRKQSHLVTQKELAKMLDMDYANLRRLMSSLIKKGIIGKHQSGQIFHGNENDKSIVYTVNPYIYFKGRNINKTVLAFYNERNLQNLLSQE